MSFELLYALKYFIPSYWAIWRMFFSALYSATLIVHDSVTGYSWENTCLWRDISITPTPIVTLLTVPLKNNAKFVLGNRTKFSNLVSEEEWVIMYYNPLWEVGVGIYLNPHWEVGVVMYPHHPLRVVMYLIRSMNCNIFQLSSSPWVSAVKNSFCVF